MPASDRMGSLTSNGRSLDQCFSALAKGNAIRQHKAAAKRELVRLSASAALARVGRWLLDPDDVVGAFAASELLEACPHVGAVKASKLLRAARVTPSRRVRDLNGSDRIALALQLRQAARHLAAASASNRKDSRAAA